VTLLLDQHQDTVDRPGLDELEITREQELFTAAPL
jgi:hypothetical protein